MGLVTLYKPNGKEMLVNENSVEYAKKVLNWTEKKPATRKIKKQGD